MTDGKQGGLGGRDKESLNSGCVPAYINDNTTRYFDEVVTPPDVYSLEIPEKDIMHLPQIIEEGQMRLREYQEQAQCACRVRCARGGRVLACHRMLAHACEHQRADGWWAGTE